MIVFETERLRIRPLIPTDLPAFQTMQGNANVMRYTTGIPLTPAESARDLAKIIAQYDVEGNETWVWAVTANQDVFIGTCALFKNEEQVFEIAYRLVDACWGLGYGQEIADGLIAYCLDELGLPQLVAQTVKDNLASVNILDRSKLSFVAEIENVQKNWIERHYRYAVVTGG
jgi:ribosomal-protein-alanine N-acetyltransferase